MFEFVSWQFLAITVCTVGGILSLLSSFAIKLVESKLEEKESLLESATTKFPPKEDKLARRNRWAQVLPSRHTVPLKSLPYLYKKKKSTGRKKATVREILCFFLVADRHRRGSSCQGINPSKKIKKHVLDGIRNLPTHPSSSGEATEVSLGGKGRNKRNPEGIIPFSDRVASPPTLDELEQVRRVILTLLLQFGPSKSLSPIQESFVDLEASEVRKISNDDERRGSVKDSPTDRHISTSEESCQQMVASQLDEEPIFKIWGAHVSREMLWRALAAIGRPESG